MWSSLAQNRNVMQQKKAEQRRRCRSNEEMDNISQTTKWDSSSSSSLKPNNSHTHFAVGGRSSPKHHRPANIISSLQAASLDRIKLSNRDAVYVLFEIAILVEYQQDVSTVPKNCTTLTIRHNSRIPSIEKQTLLFAGMKNWWQIWSPKNRLINSRWLCFFVIGRWSPTSC